LLACSSQCCFHVVHSNCQEDHEAEHGGLYSRVTVRVDAQAEYMV
jgi:hypothetical protein